MVLSFVDKTLVCLDCDEEFTWSAREQEFYAVMGFDNEPKRCPTCRDARRFGGRRPVLRHEVVCASCGNKTSIPFVPRESKPFYCPVCHAKQVVTPLEAA